MRAVLYRTERVRAALKPHAQRVVAVVVRVTGCDQEDAGILVAHVALAAVSAGALALASGFTHSGVSALLKVAGAATVGAIAVHAAVVVVRRRRGALERGQMRSLLTATIRGVVSNNAGVPAARVLAIACEPRQLWQGIDIPSSALQLVLQEALGRAVFGHVRQVIPGVVQAKELLGVYRTTLESARFVREFALTAGQLDSPASAA